MRHILRIKHKDGFTLAEVLIVLVIAALIAAIGVPPLVSFVEYSSMQTCCDNADAIASMVERHLITEQFFSPSEVQQELVSLLERLSDNGVTVSSLADEHFSAYIRYGGEVYSVLWSYDAKGSIPDFSVYCNEHDVRCTRSFDITYINMTVNNKKP